MRVRGLFTTIFVTAALTLALGTALMSYPKRSDGSGAVALPITHREPARDRVIFAENWEDGADRWHTGDLTNVENAWHKTDFNVPGVNREAGDVSFWCGDTITGLQNETIGYKSIWLQWLDTPELDLSQAGNNLQLTFDAYWLVEDPRRVPGGLGNCDAWDGWQVLISIDGGDNFQVIRPVSPAYTAEHISAAERYWRLGGDWPGWTFESKPNGREGWEDVADTVITPEWLECSFDLSNYRRAGVVIRFQFESDRTVAAPYYYYLRNSGAFIDNLMVQDGGGNVFLENNGTDAPVPGELVATKAPGFGDHWALTNENRHAGQWSMWNDDDHYNVNNFLDSPTFHVPAEGNTHLEFWVRADLPDAVHNGSNALSDFWQLYTSNDGGNTWVYFTHDYNRPEAGGDGWTNYLPQVPFSGNLDLSFSSDTTLIDRDIQMRWMFIADNDDNMGNGSGLFLDDIQVINQNQQPRDIGMENLYVPYPLIARSRLAGVNSKLVNYGTAAQNQVRSQWGWSGAGYSRSYQIVPYPSIGVDSSKVISLSDYVDRRNPGWTPLYPGVYTVYSKTSLGMQTPDDGDDDLVPENDSTGLSSVYVWPTGVYELGYDGRRAEYPFPYVQGEGPAARFSPTGALDRYSVAFLSFTFDGSQQGDASCRVHVRGAGRNNETPGNDLYAFNMTVPADRCFPEVMTFNLSDRQELQNLNGDFWVWVEITREDGYPLIVGDSLYYGVGRFYGFNGRTTSASDGDLMIHAGLIPAANTAANLVESEQLVDFGAVEIGQATKHYVSLYATGLTPVTITRVTTDDNAFTVDWPGDVTIKPGEWVRFVVTFEPPNDSMRGANLVIQSNDDTPPQVRLVGSGPLAVPGSEPVTPQGFTLSSPYPNPFNSSTRIDFSLVRNGNTNLAIYDLAGRKMLDLAAGEMTAGSHSVTLNAAGLPAGVYLVRLSSGDQTAIRKVALVK